MNITKDTIAETDLVWIKRIATQKKNSKNTDYQNAMHSTDTM